MSEKITAARQTYLNMLRIVPEMQQKEGETKHQLRIRCENFVAKRWGCSFDPVKGSSVIRHFTADRYPPYRAPTTSKNVGFFRDLKEYGGAKFKKDGTLIESSLGKGMDLAAYVAEFNEYARLRTAAKAAEERAALKRAS